MPASIVHGLGDLAEHVFVLSPPPVDDAACRQNGFPRELSVVQKYALSADAVAKAEGAHFVDLFTELQE